MLRVSKDEFNITSPKFFGFVMAGMALLASGPVHAQGVFDMGSLTATLSVDHVTQSEEARASGINSSDLSQNAMQFIAQPISKNYNHSDTKFQVSKQLRKSNLAQIVKKTAATDPKGAREMAKLFASGDVIEQIGQGIAPFGLRTDNVADAYTVYWMTAWQAVNQDSSDFTRSQVDAVRQQSAGALMNTEAFVNADDRLRQELAEIYLVQAALIQAVADEAKSDSNLRSDLASSVNKGARASGLDLTKMDLTENGFVPRSGGRSDASDALDGADPAAAPTDVAANDDAGGNDTGKLALYGVGGVALLAGMFALGKSFGGKG